MANILIHGDTTLGGALIHRDSLTGFPANPKPYTQVIKDGVPYSYVDMSGGQGTLYSWLPMANKPNTYLHQQGIAATEITVQHNMGTEHVGIFVYDVDNGMVLANFDIVNANQIVVHLSEAITCNIIVFGYNVIGAATLAGSTVQVGSIELTESVNGNLLVNGQALATNDRVDAILALAPEEFDTFKEVADNLALKADASSVYTKAEVDTSLATKANTTHNHAFADITSKPTTVSGYGISDAYTKAEVNTSLATKANTTHNHAFADITSKPTTVSGYGISDAYTKSEVDTMKSQYLLASGGTLTGAITSFRETKAATTGAINLASGNLFTITVGANTSFSVSNTPTAGQAYSFVLEITNGGSKTIGYWTGVKWAGGTAPTLTAAGTDVLGFYTHNGGASWVGLTLAKDVK